MNTYVMLGNYLPGEVRNVAAHRTAQLREIVSKNGGNVISAYGLLGRNDLVLVVELPRLEDAMRAAVELGIRVGASFQTSPALPIDDFDRLVEDLTTEIESDRMEARE